MSNLRNFNNVDKFCCSVVMNVVLLISFCSGLFVIQIHYVTSYISSNIEAQVQFVLEGARFWQSFPTSSNFSRRPWSWRQWRSQGEEETSVPGRSIFRAWTGVGMPRNVKCQRIYKMPNASRWYPVVKYHQSHQGLQREQLWTLVTFQIVANCVSRNQCPHVV